MAWQRVGALLGLASIALGACAPAENQQAGPAAPAAPGIALYSLDCGRIVTSDAAPFSDDHAYDGQTKELVDPCYLIRHPGGDLLWDAGWGYEIPKVYASGYAVFVVGFLLTGLIWYFGLRGAA